jgi:hypothetical protein
MKSKLVALVAAVAILAAAVPVSAHHSFAAEFDATKTVTLTGVITKVQMMNPHAYLYIDVRDPATGKVSNWATELDGPNQLMRRGWTRDTLKVGMVVTVEGFLARDGSNKANGKTLTVDGKKVGAQ